jgi:hypothetical protein
VGLYGTATVTNEGSISGGTYLGGYASLTNSGTMDNVYFLDATTGSSFTNSGLLTGGLNESGASFVAQDSGTIDGGMNLASATGTIHVSIASTGVVTSLLTGNNALEVNAGAYDIWTAGQILASGAGDIGVDVHGGGQIVNRGKIAGEPAGVYNNAAAGVAAALYNYGSIDAAQGIAIQDVGGHTARVVNYGALAGGPGYYGVYADTATVESLTNAGTIDGGVLLDAAGSAIVNTGTVNGAVDLFGGSDGFTNKGLVNGDIAFSGTGNVYNGSAGSVTGTIHGAGADGVYYGGNDGETFDMTASGAKYVASGSGSDTFKFTAAGLTRATTVQGGAGTGVDTLDFTTAGTISASQLFHVLGIEQIDLANGTNSIALTDALVASASQASLTLLCGSGADTINASGVTSAANKLTIDAGSGVDKFIAGGGSDTFVYTSASQSTGPAYDTITGANWALDKFDLNGAAVTKIDPAVTVGSLSTATFNTDLAAAIGVAQLPADSAVLFAPSAGTLAGHTFLVADTKGVAGYHAGTDLVFDVTGAKGTLATGNFI